MKQCECVSIIVARNETKRLIGFVAGFCYAAETAAGWVDTHTILGIFLTPFLGYFLELNRPQHTLKWFRCCTPFHWNSPSCVSSCLPGDPWQLPADFFGARLTRFRCVKTGALRNLVVNCFTVPGVQKNSFWSFISGYLRCRMLLILRVGMDWT